MIALTPSEAAYPRALRDLRAWPDPLTVDGDLGVLAQRAVSIVGTRRMTPYGERVAREIALAVASAGIVVVSGLAQGIDSVAHAAALDGGAPTIAVLGCGIAAFLEDIRGRRRTLAYRIRERGALVSQFPNDAPAQMWTFAKRNATIAALGVITVIVEAPAGSGALITAAEARTIARPVYAVPGPIGATASTGTNGLIASGEAHAVTSVSTVLQALGVRGTGRGATVREEDARVLDALAAAPSDPDALGRRLGLSAANLATIVARLAVRGLVATAPDGRLERR